MALLWDLAVLYGAPFHELLALVGYVRGEEPSRYRRQRMTVALRALEELPPRDQIAGLVAGARAWRSHRAAHAVGLVAARAAETRVHRRATPAWSVPAGDILNPDCSSCLPIRAGARHVGLRRDQQRARCVIAADDVIDAAPRHCGRPGRGAGREHG